MVQRGIGKRWQDVELQFKKEGWSLKGGMLAGKRTVDVGATVVC
jgi:hypothetical protein